MRMGLVALLILLSRYETSYLSQEVSWNQTCSVVGSATAECKFVMGSLKKRR